MPDCNGAIPIGSLIVMEGCSFYGFEGPHFDEYMREYPGPTVYSYVSLIEHNLDLGPIEKLEFLDGGS